MGAEFLAQTYDYCSKSELEYQVEHDTEQMMHEGGCSYSGNWAAKESGIVYSAIVAKSIDEAEELLYDNPKWDPLWAVQVVVSEPSKALEAKLVKAEQAVEQSIRDADKLTKSVIKSMSTAKSARRTCKCCGSAIATKYISGINCPVCAGSLASPTDQARLKSVQAKPVKLRKTLADLRAQDTSVRHWVVGGNCSS